jgi:YHS domain-containing protein
MKTVYRDPVCGKKVGLPSRTVVHKGIEYRFCGEKCRLRFSEEPDHFLDEEQKESTRATPKKSIARRGGRRS